MDLTNTVEMSAKVLIQNKMRSILTMLGVIIGVGAVIAMLSVGAGAKKDIQDRMSSLGNNVLQVFPGSVTKHGVRGGIGTSPSLMEGDFQAIKKEVTSAILVAPMVSTTSQVIYKTQNWSARLQGTNLDFLELRSWQVESGAPFTEQEIQCAAKVCLLGKTVVENLFGSEDPAGKTIRINRIPFKVVGVLETKGSEWGGDQDDTILMPYTTAMKRLMGVTFINNIQISAVSQDAIPEVKKQVTDLLRQRHHIMPGKDDDFHVRNMADIVAAATAMAGTMTMLLGSVASVSLLVGGIGIMNIMLVSVTERTREIGIRMAVGAKRFEVLLQFIIEAMMLSFMGGVIGIGTGITISFLISAIAKWAVSISAGSIILAFGFAIGIGIFFGYYPARKAADMDPIEALRYE
ncbi:multidrug ABC transporter substrate-binding protein [Candidatus Desantisbacteria bacterium CG07_land_8_20_14_0_80_39_15]|uniref:Multidrug ABC transporter substrate-binding protein n=1 Tax=Candidatus Desantisbacteria bacterium CG07_land_8_20_14_0_80_39_15 TaxID=1974549 RepID=A0A2M6ZIE8_9BACT|nr:MAG: multidrug ABC transporter substrate-binding protein [Candidatus Desantisbacteria bacterium CG07_land_8_20_14_0_80_39_15]